jgi:hypothetical protein
LYSAAIVFTSPQLGSYSPQLGYYSPAIINYDVGLGFSLRVIVCNSQPLLLQFHAIVFYFGAVTFDFLN